MIFTLLLYTGTFLYYSFYIQAERRVLKELGFCVHIKHPHKLVVVYLQLFGSELFIALFRIRIQIGSGFSQVIGSVSGIRIQEGKNDP
jgi:hypothetical protein